MSEHECECGLNHEDAEELNLSGSVMAVGSSVGIVKDQRESVPCVEVRVSCHDPRFKEYDLTLQLEVSKTWEPFLLALEEAAEDARTGSEDYNAALRDIDRLISPEE